MFEFGEAAVCGDVVIFVFSEGEGTSVKVSAVVPSVIAFYAGVWACTARFEHGCDGGVEVVCQGRVGVVKVVVGVGADDDCDCVRVFDDEGVVGTLDAPVFGDCFDARSEFYAGMGFSVSRAAGYEECVFRYARPLRVFFSVKRYPARYCACFVRWRR